MQLLNQSVHSNMPACAWETLRLLYYLNVRPLRQHWLPLKAKTRIRSLRLLECKVQGFNHSQEPTLKVSEYFLNTCLFHHYFKF